MRFNSINNNVNTVSLARTYWGIPSLSFEIGGNTTLPRSAYGLRGSGGGIAPNLSGLRRYSPIRPRQTHSITPFRAILFAAASGGQKTVIEKNEK